MHMVFNVFRDNNRVVHTHVNNVKKERRTFLKEKKQWPYYICMVVCVDIPLIFCCISCLVVDNIVLDFVSE